MKTDWIPLHIHSQYSILDASASINKIVSTAKEYGMPAVALTDHGNLFGAVEFYKECKSQGIKPLVGCEVYVAPVSRLEKAKIPGKRVAYHLPLIAKNSTGYHNLCKLVSKGFLEGFYYYPRVDKELLKEYSEGLICLSGSLSSMVSQAALEGGIELARKEIEWHKDLFGDDFYIEVQRQRMLEDDLQADGVFEEAWLEHNYKSFIEKQESVNSILIKLSKEMNIPLVATNDSHYIAREDWKAHEILLNVQSGEPCEIWEKDASGIPKFRVSNPKRKTYPSHLMHFRSSGEMASAFKDIPDAIENTLKVAEKCTLEIDFDTKHYPIYIPPHLEGKDYTEKERVLSVEKYLRDLCEKNIPIKYKQEQLDKVAEKYPGKDPLEVVKERLDIELSIIVPKGMCDYLLIVWDFIHWAKNQNIPVGPGRGSGAGSIVLFLIGVTDIEPLRFHLFFERFINPERFSYPDIDVDICMDRRSEVIAYTLEKYGHQNVAQIITFGTMKAKMVVKDVGRVLSVPLVKVNKIAGLIPEDPKMTLSKALEIDPELKDLYANDEDVTRIIDMGQILEGSVRNTGIHAAGVIVCGDSLTNHIPLCTSKDSEIPVTQYSMKYVEAVGMLKIDFLGLKTLTCIVKAVEMIERGYNKKLDWTNLPLEDAATFALLNQGKTLGVFQMESGGMQDLAVQLHIDKFEEMIAVVALYRPGPMDMIPSFINRKHGREAIEYDHPWMKDILSETYGVMVYQEQVMQIAQKLANYSLGEGDILRKAMGKKDAEQMDLQKEKFKQGAMDNGISEQDAILIFDKMAKFASYGFNKSHAAAYGYLAYATAYLKANYQKEWMSALLTCDKDDISKVSKFLRECQKLSIPVLPPNINESGHEFTPTNEGIRFALSAVKGVGSGVVDAILEEREQGGAFKDFFDLFNRVDPKRIGKKVVESLALAGAFDFTGWERDALVQSVDQMHSEAVRMKKEKDSGVMTFLSLMGDDSKVYFKNPPEVVNPLSKLALLLKEKELLGFFLTGHPLDACKQLLQRLSCIPLNKISTLDRQTVIRTAFIIEEIKVRISSKTQRKFAFIQVSDGDERFEIPIWSDVYEQFQDILKENQLLYAVLVIDRVSDLIKLSCKWLGDIDKAGEQMVVDCDTAYDKTKRMIGFQEKNKKKAEQKVEEKEEKKVEIRMDLEKMHLSHVLALKNILLTSLGSTPVEIKFIHSNHLLADLFISKKLFVNWQNNLSRKVNEIQSVEASLVS